MKNSFFDGGLLQLIGWKFLGAIVTIFTFGICYPWALCMVYSWETRHTVINGKRLKFDGTALQLFGNWIKWWFFTLITLGIYGFWIGINTKKWVTKHTEFEDYCEETIQQSAPTLGQTPASFAPINSGYTAATAVSSAAQTEKKINGVLSLGFVFGGVALSVLGLGLFLFDYILPGIAVFGIGLVLLLISYFNQ